MYTFIVYVEITRELLSLAIGRLENVWYYMYGVNLITNQFSKDVDLSANQKYCCNKEVI